MPDVPDTIVINIALGNKEYTEDQVSVFRPIFSQRAEVSILSDSFPEDVGQECVRMIEDVLEKLFTDLAELNKERH